MLTVLAYAHLLEKLRDAQLGEKRQRATRANGYDVTFVIRCRSHAGEWKV